MQEKRPSVRILKDIIDAFNRHDPDPIMRYFAPDCVLESARGPYPYGHRFRGAAAVREALRSAFKQLPDAEFSEVSHFLCEDRGASEWKLRGTRLSGERIEVYGCYIFSFRNGLISKMSAYWKVIKT